MARTTAEYRANAEECRVLARDTSLTEEQRQRLLDMAKTWDSLADDREKAIGGQPPRN